MNPALFGTDGVRGVANADLTAELALALGRAVARTIPATGFLVGRDTRRSGPLLQAAFSSGIATEGADVVDVGVIPTPGLAFLSANSALPAAMVSASHNDFPDNGIKLFGIDGKKLSVATEEQIEKEWNSILADPDRPPIRPTGYGVGRIDTNTDMVGGYQEHLLSTQNGRSLDGMHIVLDCANGAASDVAPFVLKELGATLTVIGCEPDGTNINDGCGSTDPTRLAELVVSSSADIGLALDGDADRLVAVDAEGSVVDGDALLAMFALDLAERGKLSGNTVVVTVMTNLGFKLAMAERGIVVKETPVGDRHVLAALDADGLALGGEQSGHVVFRQLATTGDGILTGLCLCDLLVRKGVSLREHASGVVRRIPQVLVNVPVATSAGLQDAAKVWESVAKVEADLGDSGRVLVRASGTEPLIRIMVESTSQVQAEDAAHKLRLVVKECLDG
ncbi:MAG: phosphoglucosamine mutase [Actinobacteria bacterium]|nr:phosphoglucosamine mutase [Actinomycetota bacterium]MCL5445690.1 phosphoglucosamine mutase [Actinomycetota bacterium]